MAAVETIPQMEASYTRGVPDPRRQKAAALQAGAVPAQEEREPVFPFTLSVSVFRPVRRLPGCCRHVMTLCIL